MIIKLWFSHLLNVHSLVLIMKYNIRIQIITQILGSQILFFRNYIYMPKDWCINDLNIFFGNFFFWELYDMSWRCSSVLTVYQFWVKIQQHSNNINGRERARTIALLSPIFFHYFSGHWIDYFYFSLHSL